MIDFDLAKCVVIGLVALVVLGPQRLPYVARTAGALLGRAQRYFNQIKTEVAREVELEEIQKMKGGLEQAAVSLHDLFYQTTQQTVHGLNDAFLGDTRQTKISTATGHSNAAAVPPVRSGTRRSHWRTRQTAQPLWYKRATLKRAQQRASLRRQHVYGADKDACSRKRSRTCFFI